MEEKKILTYEELMAGFDEIREQQKENAKGFAELREREEENSKKWAELREREEERTKKREKELAELEKFIKEVSKNVDGINKSGGMAAEEAVFNFLDKTMTFGGNHFDAIQQNVHSKRKLSNGEKIEAEYDVLMINDVSVCIVEIKSRARESDIKDLAENKAAKFKMLFPIFANHKLYLGIAAMSFEKSAEKEAKNLGIGILKPKGDFVEIYDDNLRDY